MRVYDTVTYLPAYFVPSFYTLAVFQSKAKLVASLLAIFNEIQLR